MTMSFPAILLQSAAGLLVGMTVFVVVRYFVRWRRGHSGMLPLHIWMVALSYDLLIIAIAIQSTVLIRWWHWWFYVPALVLGFPAMYLLSGSGPRRDGAVSGGDGEH